MSHVPALDAAWTAPRRAGYDASAAATAARVLLLLADERVVWLSTVRPDGTPHIVPAWFLWDGEALVVCSKPEAAKIRNLLANPRLMVALGDPEDDFAVGLIEAEARVLPDAPVPDAFLAKYAAELAHGPVDATTFRATFTCAIRITPTRFLAWHGRGDGAARVAAVRPHATLAARVAALLDRLAERLRGGPIHAPLAA
jgi:PPOX class probable F420-dependent enzyme